MTYDRVVIQCKSMRPYLWSGLGMLHINTEKIKVNKFVFSLNFNSVKVRILMPQTLHNVVQKDLIAEEELNNGGQGRTPARPIGQTTSGVQHHQTPTRQASGHQDTSRGPMFMTPR